MRHVLTPSALVCAMALPAQADIDATNPQLLMDLMAAHGQELTLGADDVGDPKITGTLRGVDYTVFFYGCSGGRYCTNIQYRVGFDLDDGLTLDRANTWNRDERWASTYLDEDSDPHLQMDVHFGTGMEDDTFLESYTIWLDTMDSFMDYIDW